jgi:hypothetical protein
MKKYYPILHTIARYFLATIILMYAISKIMGTQFSSTPSVWDKTIGELSGFELTWFYYGYSFWYGIFIASSQIIAAFLLFFRQTTRLGIVLYLSIMVNILVLDIAYEINGGIGMAIVLTSVAMLVFLLEFNSFYEFFIKRPPLFKSEDRPKWLNKISKGKFIYIPLVIVGLFILTYTLKINIMTKNEFYGAWKPNNHMEWNRIYFQEASTFSIRTGKDFNEVFTGKYSVDRTNKKIDFKAYDQNYIKDKIDVLNPDSTRMKILFKMNYKFEQKSLLLFNDSLKLKLGRLK